MNMGNAFLLRSVILCAIFISRMIWIGLDWIGLDWIGLDKTFDI